VISIVPSVPVAELRAQLSVPVVVPNKSSVS